MPFLEHDSLKFHFLERGSGVPFVFQHGLGGDTQKVFSQLHLPDGLRSLGLDCRAHGSTAPTGPLEKLRFDAFADDVIAMLDYLGLARAVLGGTSMGAGVALNCALRYPQRASGLVLLRPAWLDAPNPDNVKVFGTIAAVLREHGAERGREVFQRHAVYAEVARQSSDSAESLLGLFTDPRAAETVARLELIPQDAPNRDRAAWQNVAVPTLIMATGQDPIHPVSYARVLASIIPGAEFRLLTSKSANLTQYTHELNQHLASFLQPFSVC